MGGAKEEIWTLPWRRPPPSPQLGQARKLNEIAGPGYPCKRTSVQNAGEIDPNELDDSLA